MATQFPTYALTLEGSDAITAVTDPLYATTAQGALADTATQPGDLGTAAAANVGDFATAAQGATADAAVEAVATVTKLYGPITQAAYDLLTPAADTLYVIVG